MIESEYFCKFLNNWDINNIINLSQFLHDKYSTYKNNNIIPKTNILVYYRNV